MTMQFGCPTCGSKVRAPESAVGKKARCPACKAVFVVPLAVREAKRPDSPVVEIDEDPPERQERRIDDEPKSDLRPCPMCGELIKSSALKCRYCGEMVDEEERAERNRPIVVTPTKSVGIAILLTILFGPLGMLYSTVPGALIMMGVNASIFFLSICTGGLGAILFLFTWPICVVWGAVAASSYNAKLMAGGRGP